MCILHTCSILFIKDIFNRISPLFCAPVTLQISRYTQDQPNFPVFPAISASYTFAIFPAFLVNLHIDSVDSCRHCLTPPIPRCWPTPGGTFTFRRWSQFAARPIVHLLPSSYPFSHPKSHFSPHSPSILFSAKLNNVNILTNPHLLQSSPYKPKSAHSTHL